MAAICTVLIEHSGRWLSVYRQADYSTAALHLASANVSVVR